MFQPECVLCGKPAGFECDRCGVEAYCSANCQKEDWPAHGSACQEGGIDARVGYRSRRPILSYLSTNYKKFYSMIISAGLLNDIARGKHTIFAPDDDAITNFEASLRGRKLGEESTRKLVEFHVIGGEHLKKQLESTREMKTIGGETLKFSYAKATGDLTLNPPSGIEVERANLRMRDGVIHKIGGVLVPFSLQQQLFSK